MTECDIRDVPVEEIEIFASQSRETFDETELINLSEDIKLNGQLQPGVAWLDEGRGRLILVCGERRLRAIRLAGRPTMAVKVIRGKLTQAQLLAMNIAENLQRSSLNPIERGHAFRRMMQLESITAREVALRLHVSDATVSRDLSLLDLSPTLQNKVASGELPSSVAASLARLADDETRRFLAEQYANGLSRDGIAAEVSKRLSRKRQGKAAPARLPIRLGGVSITVTSKQVLSWKELGELADRLRREVKPLIDAGSGGEPARPLKAS